MLISVGPFITCFLVILILTVYTYIIIYVRKGLLYQNMKFAFAVIGLILIRMLLPVNFPFMVSIYLEAVMAPISEFLFRYIGDFHFGLAEILFVIWGIGAILKLVCLIRKQIAYKKTLNAFLVDDLRKYPELFHVLQTCDIPELQVSIVPNNISPAIYGRRHPVLILPEWDFTEKELYFICNHEISHYKNHDLWLNLFLGLVCCAQWFNPLAKQLQKELTLAYEVANDQTVLKKSSEGERVEYANLILKTARKLETREKNDCVVAFTEFCQPETKTRLEYILAKEEERVSRKENIYLHYAFIFILFLISFFVVPEAYCTQTIDSEGAFAVLEDNSYIVKSGDNYLLYVDGEYVYTLSPIPEEFKDIPVIEEDENEK